MLQVGAACAGGFGPLVAGNELVIRAVEAYPLQASPQPQALPDVGKRLGLAGQRLQTRLLNLLEAHQRLAFGRAMQALSVRRCFHTSGAHPGWPR